MSVPLSTLLRQCPVCTQPATHSLCARCKMFKFCSPECEAKDAKAHEENCYAELDIYLTVVLPLQGQGQKQTPPTELVKYEARPNNEHVFHVKAYKGDLRTFETAMEHVNTWEAGPRAVQQYIFAGRVGVAAAALTHHLLYTKRNFFILDDPHPRVAYDGRYEAHMGMISRPVEAEGGGKVTVRVEMITSHSSDTKVSKKVPFKSPRFGTGPYIHSIDSTNYPVCLLVPVEMPADGKLECVAIDVAPFMFSTGRSHVRIGTLEELQIVDVVPVGKLVKYWEENDVDSFTMFNIFCDTLQRQECF